MITVVVNFLAIVVGSGIGLLAKRGIPKHVADALMSGIALCILYIGWSGALVGENSLVLIISMALGTMIGEGLDLDSKFNGFVHKAEDKLKKGNTKNSMADGFITASLLFCVGAMAIVGSIQAGLSAEYSTIFTKSVIDCIVAAVLASTLGIGVMLSAVSVAIYQGAIVLLSQLIAPYLGTSIINEMTCVGSVLIFGLGLNMLGLTKLKLLNFLPAVFFPILVTDILYQIL
ncbi:MAG: DUF554 domain-containing protein [Bacillota bacterium]